jgi:hypothetical protein
MSMTLEEQFKAARDVSPRIGCKIEVIDGKTVRIPILEASPIAIFMAEDQGSYIDSVGDEWKIGMHKGELVKSRLG